MTDKFNQALRSRRVAKGLDEREACRMFGLSINEYYDLEVHEDEWFMVVPTHVIRRIVSFFELDWAACYDWPAGTIRVPTPRRQPLDEFIRQIREKRGLSRAAFADRVGFHEPFSDVIEGHPDGLLLWPIEPAMLLAKAFDIDGKSLAARLLAPTSPSTA